MLRAAKGDKNALSYLYGQFSKQTFGICARMMNNITDAEDALQDIFIQAFKELGQIKNAAGFGGWLRQVTINACIQRLKKQQILHFADTQDFEIAEEPPEDCWYADVDMQTLNKAIKELPSGCRQVFVLYAVEDYTHKEIAQHMNISEGTSKSQYSRARNLLKEQISKQIIHG